jgi:carboxynorspermidine decarboxylase
MNDLSSVALRTPAFVYEEEKLLYALEKMQSVRRKTDCKILYSVKALSCPGILEILAPHLNGFSASSLFEAKLSRHILNSRGTVHLTCPAIVEDEIPEIATHADYISFNSLSQWNRFKKKEWKDVRLGLRINPQLSFIRDDRYNPCRQHSKLGISIDVLSDRMNSSGSDLENISGIHFHTNCESRTVTPLLETVIHVSRKLKQLLPHLDWINLGGGYQYDEIDDLSPVIQAVDYLKNEFGLQIFLEPGEAIVGRAGSLITTVLDIFESDRKQIAIIDSTVNHMPQVFEYQYQPTIIGSDPNNLHSYLIAGRTCLSGDLFGEHRFSQPLEIGSRLAITFAGAYSLVKAHMFNGINLPSIYLLTKSGQPIKLHEFSYEDFWTASGGDNEAYRAPN